MPRPPTRIRLLTERARPADASSKPPGESQPSGATRVPGNRVAGIAPSDAPPGNGPVLRTAAVARAERAAGAKRKFRLFYVVFPRIPGHGYCSIGDIQGARMFSKPFAVGLLAIACVTAAAAGSYVAVRQNQTLPAASTVGTTVEGQAQARPAVQETEAVVTPAAAPEVDRAPAVVAPDLVERPRRVDRAQQPVKSS